MRKSSSRVSWGCLLLVAVGCRGGTDVWTEPVDAVVSSLSLPANPGGDVAVGYVLADPSGLPVDLYAEFSFDGGRRWRPAHAAAGARTRSLTTSVQGVAHSFTWDSLADAGFRHAPGQRLRLTPMRGSVRGRSTEIEIPPLDNLRRAAARVEHYYIDYGAMDAGRIALAQTYQLAIVHPANANLTRTQIRDIQDGIDPNDPADDVIVLGYISIGEDLRTVTVNDEQLRLDPRFVGNGTGPRIDPRGPDADGQSLAGIDPLGIPSNGGTGFASFYLDDNSVDRSPTKTGDGIPDRNSIFGGCFVNAGDPEWYAVLDAMLADSGDGVPGMREILTRDFGRGLGCDGLFLDTVDTCAPNFFTDGNAPNQSEFEWTAPGFRDFIARLRAQYPASVILQNRGLFFYDPRHPHYSVNPRALVDYVKFESYRLNSNTFEEFSPYFYPDNKFNVAPKLMAEANRPDGFRVLSLGYAEGPPDTMDRRTLTGGSSLGFASLMADIRETQDLVGFRHFLSDGGVTLANTFVRDHSSLEDHSPPVWSSTFNANVFAWPLPPLAPDPRVGACEAIAGMNAVTLRWDVALDLNPVHYAIYYDTRPFDFDADPELRFATRVVPLPEVGEGYANYSATTYPYQGRVTGLLADQQYWFCVRAFDSAGNEERNRKVVTATPTGFTTIRVDGLMTDWARVPAAHTDPADVPDSAGPDWLELYVANDEDNLYIRYRSRNAFNLDGSPTYAYSRTLIFLDLDANAATGYTPRPDLGSELVVAGDGLFRQSAGQFNGGLVQNIAVAPRFNVTDCELSIPLARIYEQVPGATGIRLLFVNDDVNDYAPDAGFVAYSILRQ